MVSSAVHSKVDDFRPMTSSVVILLLGHYLVLPVGLEPVPLRSQPSSPVTSPAARMDEHPVTLHLAVAYTSHTESVAVKTVNRTLQQLAPELATLGITLSPLYTALGDRFSAAVLANLCESWNSSTVLAALVLADHLPGLLPALAAVSAGVPVLWVTGHVRQGYLEPVSMSSLELRMEVSAGEMMRALRSLLLQAHWHTFSLVSAVAHPLPSKALDALRSPPLQPLFRTLRPDASSTVMFRILSEISRATKGVVVLISDGRTAKRIMSEAARLNMVAGNFVWIWIDSDAHVTAEDIQHPTPEPTTDHVTEPLTRRRKTRESTSKLDWGSKKVDQGSNHDHVSRGNRGSEVDRESKTVDQVLRDDRGSRGNRGSEVDRDSKTVDRVLRDDRWSKHDRGSKTVDQGSNHNHGSRGNRGTKVDQESKSFDQGDRESKLGSKEVDQRSRDDRGSKVDPESKPADQGSKHDRESKSVDQGSRDDRGSKYDRKSKKVDQGSSIDQGSIIDEDSLLKLELESIVNSVIRKQMRISDKKGDILRNSGVRLENDADNFRKNVDDLNNNGDNLINNDEISRSSYDKLRSNSDSKNNGDVLRSNDELSSSSYDMLRINNNDDLKNNGDQLKSSRYVMINNGDSKSNSDKLRNNNDESRKTSDGFRPDTERTYSDRESKKDNYENSRSMNNDGMQLNEQLRLEMESMIRTVIEEQIRSYNEKNSNTANNLEFRYDKSLENSNVEEFDKSVNSRDVRTNIISEEQLESNFSNSSVTPNSSSDNSINSDNRLRDLKKNVEETDKPRKLDEGIDKPLEGDVNQVSWDIVRIVEGNNQEEKRESGDEGYSETFEVRSAQRSNEEQFHNLQVDSHSNKVSNQDVITNSIKNSKIPIKSSEVEYSSELKQKSNDVDEYKEYLCSSSSGVHEEQHKQDEICREFRIKKHQLLKTIKVGNEESVKNVDFENDLATVREKGGRQYEFKKSVMGENGGKDFEFKKSVTGGISMENSDKVSVDDSVIDSTRTSVSNSEETNKSRVNNKVLSEYGEGNDELFVNRTILPRSKTSSSSILRRLRRNAKIYRQNVPKPTIPAKTFPARTFPAKSVPAKSVPANTGAIARENVTAKIQNDAVPALPVGLLAIRPVPFKVDRHFVRSAVRTIVEALKRAVQKKCEAALPSQAPFLNEQRFNCWTGAQRLRTDFTDVFSRELRQAVDEALAGRSSGTNETVGNERMAARIQILNLVPEKSLHNATDQQKQESKQWKLVGEIVGHSTVRLDSIVWPGGHLVPASTPKGARSVFRVVTALAPPFVMEGELDEDGQCLRGLECHRLLTSDKDNLTLVFNDMDRMEDADPKHHLWGISYPRYKYVTSCCYGLTMDLLENVAEELEFDFHLYVVADGMHGSRKGAKKWNGVVGDLMSGAAHMSFAALSVNSPRSEVIDFSVPYFFSGVSLLAAPKQRTDIPLLAFLLPFSPELWIAIFTSLNVTAVAVAIYEWLSPFGLNPWGRQRSKNFSMSSAMWVCWGLLCGHLVAFKAPKSWPNKFLINVWGGFSVIFVASYTANIAALIAGLFFQNAVGDYHDRSLLSQRVATPKASAADYYIHKANQMLWDHVQKYSVTDVAEGVKHLKNGTLDVLIADTPILDYYRATDNGCKLMKFGDTINEDTYAVGMTKGFPLKDSISAVMAKYSSNGYMDILQEKWYGGLPCFKLATEMAQPRPLGVAAVAGVFLLLGLGMVVGCLILLAEHLFYRYTLPILRHKPKGTIWRSRNIMFFSQKLYRFINCVELVSPHHAARELVHTIRQGQITSLFQKSVKRKEHEQRRRRRSKAQFFEMIQEIRRVQQEERVSTVPTPHLSLPAGEGGRSPRSKKLQLTRSPQFLSPPDPHRRNSRLPTRLELARRLSRDVFRSKSSGNLRRMSSDISMGRLLDCHSSQAIGRRLSRDTNLSPPDINSRRASYLSDGRRVPSMDIGSSCDITAPKSPNYLTMPGHIPTVQSIPDNILTPSGLLPDAAVSRFSYIDIKSPSFKNKLSHRHEPAGLSLSLGDRHPTSWSSSFTEVNPRVIVCDNNELDQELSIVDQPKQENATINQDVSAAKRPSIDHRWSANDQKPSINQDVSAAKRPSIDQRWSTNDQKSKTDQKHTAERSSLDQKHNVDDYSNAQKTRTGDRPSINSNDQKHSSFDHPPDHSLTNNEQKLKQSSWSNSSVNSTEHMIQIIIPSEDAASANDKGTSSGSSAVTTIKSSPEVTHQKPPIAIKPPKVVPHPKPASVKSSPKVVADQKMALNMVLNELKERCKEVNAATASDAAPPTAPPKIVSYIPKKPARKSLETVQRSLDDGSGASAVEKRRAAVEQQRGKSLDRMGDHRTSSTDKLVDKPPPLPAKKERRRVHKVRSSECCERLSVAETEKCATEVACDRTRDRRPLVTSRSNDEATSNRVVHDDAISARPEKRHPVSSSSLDRKDVTSSKAST